MFRHLAAVPTYSRSPVIPNSVSSHYNRTTVSPQRYNSVTLFRTVNESTARAADFVQQRAKHKTRFPPVFAPTLFGSTHTRQRCGSGLGDQSTGALPLPPPGSTSRSVRKKWLPVSSSKPLSQDAASPFPPPCPSP